MSARQFPIQTKRHASGAGKIGELVYMSAYEVYKEVYGAQPAMVDFDKGCRGGFGTGEIVAFLYAKSFPRSEWSQRVDEAFNGMEGLA